jgi:hypothetical protein
MVEYQGNFTNLIQTKCFHASECVSDSAERLTADLQQLCFLEFTEAAAAVFL